jgi:gliding motility-associated-like protein
VTAINGQCRLDTTIKVTVYNATLTITAADTICAGESVQLTANGSTTGQYDWSTGETTATINPSPTVTTPYDLTFSYGENYECELYATVNVTVVPNFMLSVVSDPDTNRINIGDPISLMAVVKPSQNLSNFQFQWLENGSVNIGNTETVETTPSTSDSTIYYTLTVTSPAGCVQQVQVKFTLVQPLVIVPNAFTPNSDGVNDVFRLKILEGSATILSMEIYNRWGEKVYSSNDPDAAWDGKMDDGKEAASDVYAYFIRWQRGDGALQPPKQGDVTLLR